MNRLLLLLLSAFLLPFSLFAQREETLPANPYAAHFNEAYSRYPDIPRGVLEAVAFTNTRFAHLTDADQESCIGMPHAYGVMGLMEDGKGWFRNNLLTVAEASGFTADEIKSDPRKNILAYAKALNQELSQPAKHSFGNDRALRLKSAIVHLSELPHDYTEVNEFCKNSFLYSVFSFMNDERYASFYHFPQANYDLKHIFGENNYKILSAGKITIGKNSITDEHGNTYRTGSDPSIQSADYGPAVWVAAPSCNYSSRNGTLVSAVTIHDIEGTYSSCISWFQNCNASVSAHYVVRSSDGQITQMVLEANKAWHVGSENPYTVGIEHEGYASQSGWYTNAMYTSSAALVRDICTSNGIDPLRTGWWPWLHTTYYNQSSIPGACTKVKGHQHYPNQTHNDPGPNWDWDYFYRLVNNNPPAATTLTTATGNFYDSGGASANYSDDERSIWTIAPANATSVTISFSSFSLENTWDYLFIYDGADINAPLIGYYTGTNNPGTITSSGGSLTFEFRSDCATNAGGWNASWQSTINVVNTDVTAPSTTVSVNGSWQTGNFSANFSETDNAGGSGLEKSFYQVIDYDGTDWRANNTRGFFSDNFDLATIHPDWTIASGTWATNNGVLEQSDETNTNTNIYAPLTQNLSNKYLYNWAGKIDGTGNNRRAGFHFCSDNGAGVNRGNSYFVWFRVDQSACEFYKVVNDVFTLENSVPMTVNAGQWYDWKVIYDRITGEIDVYQDNAFVGSWTDASPYSNGAYVSFRSGDANWQVNNFKVYRSRYSNAAVTVNVGNCASCDIRYQNVNPSTPAGRVKSIVRDSADNLSAVAYQDVNVDWTVPLPIDTINDGVAADIDLSTSPTDLAANWSASSDPNSGLARYYYALGTTAGDSDVVAWNSNWGYDTVALTALPLQTGQWYYFSVRAENGAGLITQRYTSDGVLVDLTTNVLQFEDGFTVNAAPNPFTENALITYQLPQATHVHITLYDAGGRAILLTDEEQVSGTHTLQIDGSSLSSGMYMLRFTCGNSVHTMPVIKR